MSSNFEPTRTSNDDFERSASDFVSRDQVPAMFRDPFANSVITKVAAAEPEDVIDRGLQKLASLADGQALVNDHIEFGTLYANVKIAYDCGDVELIAAADADMADFKAAHPNL